MAVYFAQEESLENYIKIGFAHDPVERINGFKCTNPRKINIIGLMDGDFKLEKKLHKKFKKFNLNGEWHKPCDEILNFIKKNALPFNVDQSGISLNKKISLIVKRDYITDQSTFDLLDGNDDIFNNLFVHRSIKLFEYLFDKLPSKKEGQITAGCHYNGNIMKCDFVNLRYDFLGNDYKASVKYVKFINERLRIIAHQIKAIEKIENNKDYSEKWRFTEVGNNLVQSLISEEIASGNLDYLLGRGLNET